MISNVTFIDRVTHTLNSTISKIVLAILLFSFSFNAEAQIISIGSAVGAVEGSSNISFIISIDGGGVNSTGGPITGIISYSGSATNNSDYIDVPSFSIPVGSSSTTINITVIDDAIIEGTETVLASISGLNIGTVGNPNSSAFIFDDDSGGLFISIGSPVDGTEGTSDVSFEVFIEGGGINGTGADITGSITYTGSATPGVDFIAVVNFSIPNGANSTIITLPVIDDPVAEPTETVIATLSGNPSIGVYANTASTALIYDDDAASNLLISIGSPVDGTEGGAGVSFVVSLDNGATNGTGSAITGNLSYSGTSINSSDYTALMSFSIPNGQNSTILTFPVIDDNLLECTETLIATILTTNVGVISTSTSTANIIDDECSLAAFSIVSPTDGTEGSSNASFVIALDNGLTNGTGAPVTGSIVFSGTATPGSDFANNTTFSIPDGASFGLFEVLITDDLIAEPTESVIATIGSVSIGAIGTSSVDTAYIMDNDSTNSIDEIQFSDLGISVYPNPVNSNMTIEAEQQMLGVEMSDLQGRMVHTWKVASKKVAVNITGIPDGYYIFTVLLDDGTRVSKKVLKE